MKKIAFILVLVLVSCSLGSFVYAREREPIAFDDEVRRSPPSDWGRYRTSISSQESFLMHYAVDPDLFSMKCYKTAYITWHNGLITEDGLIRIDAEVWREGLGAADFVGNYIFYYVVRKNATELNPELIAFQKNDGALELVELIKDNEHIAFPLRKDFRELAEKLVNETFYESGHQPEFFEDGFEDGYVSLNLREVNDRCLNSGHYLYSIL